ncbi:trpE operon leader peptide TrpLE [Rhizobium sp. Root482]|nr:trpE operon leader peptide TrpLE [Rhizobium sp. Root482]
MTQARNISIWWWAR